MDQARIAAALDRLRGQVVATPLIGGLVLPGPATPAGLRIKPENLQPGGSIWFRGALHDLLRQLGAPKGVVATGTWPEVAAAVHAAHALRTPAVAVVHDALLDALPDGGARALLANVGAELVTSGSVANARARADATAKQRGFRRAAGLESAAFAEGIATVGLELARDLPADAGPVFIAPPELAAPIEAGLRAGGHAAAVVGVDAARFADRDACARMLLQCARLASDPDAAAALAAARQGPADASPCVVLSS